MREPGSRPGTHDGGAQPVDSSTGPDVEEEPFDGGEPRTQSLSLGTWLSCTVDEGVVYCWGMNVNGQVGDGTREDRRVPTPALVPGEAVAVAAGQWHACALDDSGRVYCSGDGGNMAEIPRPEPIGVEDAVAIASGTVSVCAVLRDGGVSCWGAARSNGEGPAR